MALISPLIDDLDRLRRERPDWPFSDILKKRAADTYLRHGIIEPFVKTLIPLAEDVEAQYSSALKNHPLALMKALADTLGLKPSIAKKYSPDQPRVPAGSPDGGQWTGGGGGEDATATSSNRFASKPIERQGHSHQQVAGGFTEDHLKMPVQEFISENCRAGIRSVLPSQYLDMKIEDVRKLADQGLSSAKTRLKLLGRDQYRK